MEFNSLERGTSELEKSKKGGRGELLHDIMKGKKEVKKGMVVGKDNLQDIKKAKKPSNGGDNSINWEKKREKDISEEECGDQDCLGEYVKTVKEGEDRGKTTECGGNILTITSGTKVKDEVVLNVDGSKVVVGVGTTNVFEVQNITGTTKIQGLSQRPKGSLEAVAWEVVTMIKDQFLDYNLEDILFCSGEKQISVPVRVQGLESVRLIAVGAFHNLALQEDGTLWAWGNNEYGQLGTGDTQPRSQPIPVQGLSDLTLVGGNEKEKKGRREVRPNGKQWKAWRGSDQAERWEAGKDLSRTVEESSS
ncbi:hypothetical protein LR48_Vigan10g194200 [Vigna angularis]|uniref:Regulator of chromosome condensation 1/beta-lactamase-inhibitor protein II n=1 Tax=Phaseolus angularis TaxID=3914 RepID=A0A0L9VLX9_PHAAN|nr:hypothetical protein LR48_Vigan10g194200 [Vigna angularis]